MTTTLVVVVRPPKADLDVLASAVGVLARATRTTFSWLYQQGRGAAEVKRAVCARFGILARHWSGCRAASQAAARSWREGRGQRLGMLEQRIRALDDRWPKDSLHPAKKRRNAVARRKAEVAVCASAQGACRRSALVFRWSPTAASRAVAGVAPPAGFPGAVLRGDGEACRQRGCAVVCGRRLAAASAGCVFTYASRAARLCGFPPFGSLFLESAVDARRPVTWRVKLLRRGKVQLCVTFDEPEPELVSDAAAGVVGVDLNRDHLAVVDVAPDGRVGGAVRLALRTGSDAVWRVAKAVVARARRAGRPVVLENLDFRSDKAWLRSYGKRFAEVLSIIPLETGP